MLYLLRHLFGSRLLLLALLWPGMPGAHSAFGQSGGQGVNVRVMAANLNGDSQKIEPYATNIFGGLKPDVVAIQEFNYGDNSTQAFQSLINTTFGPSFSWYREPISGIPNGIISRYPFVQTGSWTDPKVGNRGFAWARIDLPGTNDLYVVSVHLLTSSSGDRQAEATALKARILENFPADAWIIVAGDFNTGSRTEAAITTLNDLLSDNPIPADAVTGGNYNTSRDRSKPYDYVLVSYTMTSRMTNTVVGAYSYPKGLVFDSRIFPDLANNVPFVNVSDSGLGQHMAVMKDFHITYSGSEAGIAPSITAHPQSRTNTAGQSTLFTAAASGTTPLTYIWSFNDGIVQAGPLSSYSISAVSESHAGAYRVVVTNLHGRATSDVANLTVLAASLAPYILEQPQDQLVQGGGTATFHVSAGGQEPLSYQWRSNTVPIPGATTVTYSVTNAQISAQADYTVLITNAHGSITSAVATLRIISQGEAGVLAGWDASGLTTYGPSPFSATTNAPSLTVGGLTRGPGVTTAATSANNAWGGNGFNSASATAAITAGDYVWWSVSVGNDAALSLGSINPFWYRRSSGGPSSGVLQAQVGSGTFSNIATLSFTAVSTVTLLPAIDLSTFAFLQNIPPQTTVTFRLVLYGATDSNGTWYVFNSGATSALDLALIGTVQPIAGPPALPPTITAVTNISGTFQFQVGGTTGSNYVVEASTNLGTAWSPIQTNTAPFLFTDTNAPSTRQRFFRSRGE